MKLNKKSQVQGQVLMMILTLLIISFIVLFGGKLVIDVSKQGTQINYLKFKTNLQNDVDAITQEYKSKKEIQLVLPSEYDEVCIVDLSKTPPNGFEIKYPIIYNYWKDYSDALNGRSSDVSRNVFLVAKQAEASFYIDKILIEPPGYLCIKETRSKISLWAEGIGNKAKLTVE